MQVVFDTHVLGGECLMLDGWICMSGRWMMLFFHSFL
jgi:hypothetical protein